LIDRIVDPSPNDEDGLDRMHVHLGASHDDATAFGERVTQLARSLAGDTAVLKVRLHLPTPYDNAEPAPPAPNVGHEVAPERCLIAVVELVFTSPLARRTFYASDAFVAATNGLADHVAHARAFAVSGVYTYVRDKTLTLAGLRGSRPAQLITQIGAVNQVQADVRHLLLTGQVQREDASE
jgi:hypothetical protein